MTASQGMHRQGHGLPAITRDILPHSFANPAEAVMSDGNASPVGHGDARGRELLGRPNLWCGTERTVPWSGR